MGPLSLLGIGGSEGSQQQVSGLSEEQQAFMNQYLKMAGQQMGQGQGYLKGVMGADSPFSREQAGEFFRTNIEAPAQQRYGELTAQMSERPGWGTAKNQARYRAGRDYGQMMAGAQAKHLSDWERMQAGWGQKQQQLGMQALGMTPEYMALNMMQPAETTVMDPGSTPLQDLLSLDWF